MATTFRELFTIFAIIGIFVLAVISFGVTFQTDNQANDTILDDERINQTFRRLGGNLSTYGNESQSQREAYESEIPERGFGTLIIFSVTTVLQTFTAMTIGIFNVLIVLPAQFLGVSSTVMAAFEAIMLVSLIILGWSVLRSGR